MTNDDVARQPERLRQLIEDLRPVNPAVAHAAELYWHNPTAYAAGGGSDLLETALGTDAHQRDVHLLRLGIALGINMEQAYPTGEEDHWPVSIDERPSTNIDAELRGEEP